MATILDAKFNSDLESFTGGSRVTTKGSYDIADVAGSLQVSAGETVTRDFTNITSGTSRCSFSFRLEDTSVAASASTLIYLMANGVVPSSGSSLCTIALSRSNSSSGSVIRITYRDNVGSFLDIPCELANLEVSRGAWWIRCTILLNHSTKTFDFLLEDKLFLRAAPWPNNTAIGFGRFAIISQASAPNTWFDDIQIEDNYSYGETILLDHNFVGASGEIETTTPTTSLRETHPQPWFIAPDTTYGGFTLGANGAVADTGKTSFALQRCGADGIIEIEFKTSVAGVAYFGMYFRFWDFPSATGAGAGVFRVSGSNNTAILQLPNRAGNIQTVQNVALTPTNNTIYTLRLEMRGRYLIGSYKAAAIDSGTYITLFTHLVSSSSTGGRGMLSEELAGPMIATTIGASDNYVRRFRFTGKTLPSEVSKTLSGFKYGLSDASIRELYAVNSAKPTANLFLSKGIQFGHRSSADCNAAIQVSTLYNTSNVYSARQYGATLSEYEHLGKADCYITLLRRGPWVSDHVLPFLNSENFAPDWDLLPSHWSANFRTILSTGTPSARSDTTYHDWISHNSGEALPIGNQSLTAFGSGQEYTVSQIVSVDTGLTGNIWDVTSKFEGSGDPISRAISTSGTNLSAGTNIRVARGFLINPDTGLNDTVLTNWRDDIKTPATLTFTTGSVKLDAIGDTNADGFNERFGWYEVNCVSTGINFTMPISGLTRYMPVFRLNNWSGQTGIYLNGSLAVNNTDYTIDDLGSGVALLQLSGSYNSNLSIDVTEAATNSSTTGAFVGIVLSILTATPSSYTDSSATGALPQLTLSTLTATTSVSSGAVASGSFQQINLSVVTGTASSETGQINSSSSGAFSNIMLSTLSGTASYEGQYPSVIQDFGPKTIQIIT